MRLDRINSGRVACCVVRQEGLMVLDVESVFVGVLLKVLGEERVGRVRCIYMRFLVGATMGRWGTNPPFSSTKYEPRFCIARQV